MNTSTLKRLAFTVFLVVLSACAPKWERPSGYRGGLMFGLNTPETVTVQRGESVYLIARRYNVPMKAMIETNQLEPPYVLYPGQVLKLVGSVIHVVERGDSLYAISRRYGVDMRAISQKNVLLPPYTIYPGQKLRLPGAYALPVNVGTESQPANTTQQLGRGLSSTAIAKPITPQITPPSRAGSRFVWPVEGKILTQYGPSGKGLHNDGINIAVKTGVSVRAAENGVVAYSGNELQGFGNLLLVKHADGWMTAYAHNESLLVKRGQEVKRGQVISKAGSSGNVQSSQLHFELRRGTKAVDPLKYLASDLI
ncbi:MAG: peptidoglycan DD-metalloendopeptidase family protein [Rhodospirillales bacterium]|jgi:murein DD-endopeptidase MepM/ murein hydrolase activator NlpD